MTPLQKSFSIDMNGYIKEEINMSITLFISITMFCGIDNILHNISHIHIECGEDSIGYCKSHETLLWILHYNKPCPFQPWYQ
jgi:hypothetical protein